MKMSSKTSKIDPPILQKINPSLHKLKRTIIPRLVLEVSKYNDTCVASNVPEFYTENGDLHVDDLSYHIKTRTTSSVFCGYTLMSVVDTEDQVFAINVSPYVFSKRLILYKPSNLCLLEMCALISMIENMSIPSLRKCASIQNRLNFLKSKCYCDDANFLVHGATLLLSTIVRYNGFVPEIHMFWKDCLTMYKIYKELKKRETEAQDLLISLFTNSGRLNEFVEYSEQMKKSHKSNFKLFYLNTILSKHYESQGVIGMIRLKCSEGDNVVNIMK